MSILKNFLDLVLETICRNLKERQQVARYVHGLATPIQDKLELSPLWTLNATVNMAN